MIFSGPLSKDESNLIKGGAILIIIFHNYFHIIPPSPGENQFAFDTLHFQRFKQLLLADPLSIIRYSFSYFGHYGVQLFIFISGYGLTISNRRKKIYYFKFITERIKKLYPTLFISVIFLLVVIPVWEGSFNPATVKSLLLKLTLLFNFIPGEALAVTGPFWFFSLIVQLYLLFPLLIKLKRKFTEDILLIPGVISLLLTLFLNNYFNSVDVSLYVTFVGHLPVFCLGIYFAYKPVIRLPNVFILVALAVFALGNRYENVWYFSNISVTIILLAFFLFLFQFIDKVKWLKSFLIYSGSISLYLFAVHGFARFPFEYISEKNDHPWITSLLCFVYLGGVYLLARGVKLFDKKVQGSLKKNHF